MGIRKHLDAEALLQFRRALAGYGKLRTSGVLKTHQNAAAEPGVDLTDPGKIQQGIGKRASFRSSKLTGSATPAWRCEAGRPAFSEQSFFLAYIFNESSQLLLTSDPR
jgi:hypothetical protein